MTSSTPADPAPEHQPAQPDPAPQQPQQPAAQPFQPAAPMPPKVERLQQARWAWAQRFTWQTRETEPLEYHRLLRGIENYRWWKPLVLLIVSGVYFGVFSVAVVLLSLPLIFAFDPTYLDDIVVNPDAVLDTQRPVSVFIAMASIIVMIPAVTLGMLTLGMKPVGRIWSVAGRLRWGLLGRLMGAAVLSVIAMNVVGIAAGLALEPPVAGAADAGLPDSYSWQMAAISMALVVLLVPFQATAEEVVFRGLFMQVLGAWVKTPWLAILLPSIGFALAHIYDIWGLAAVGLMGGVAAWLTWRTGGLEAAMAIHIVNNIIAFGFMASGLAGSTAQTEASGGPGGVIGEVAGLALFIWLTERIFTKGGHGRERIDLIKVQVPVAATSSQNGTHHA
ncbi:CPBP family intramembrane glutamic endopeptidase [Leucobacter sp. HY1908]